jgi:phosphoglycolate phosphatase-like HAD superfamily hydrolase
VIFDIDGTLLESSSTHHLLIADVLRADGLDAHSRPWNAYTNYTDWGVVDELMREARGRSVSSAELIRFDLRYRDAILRHLDASAIAEIPGAGRLLRELEAEPDVFIAFATGSLRSMAEVKLGLLGVDAATAVLATGSDYITREEIVEAVIEQTRARAGRDLKVVMLGDGIWDERTAVNLGKPFVALETGTHTFSEV